jgi:hypothetical protein
MEEWPPVWRVAANIMKKSWTFDKGCYSSLGVGRGVNNSSSYKSIIERTTHKGLGTVGQAAGTCECGNGLLGSIKCVEFPD